MSVPVSVLNLLLVAGVAALIGFIAGYVTARLRRPPCFQCGEPAVGMSGTAPLCDRHYHEFRAPGKYPGAGEG